MCVFRNTGMDDTAHVEFSRRMGELDDIRPYMTNGRKMRYQYYELFDAGNVDEDGNVIDPKSPKAQYQKACRSVSIETHYFLTHYIRLTACRATHSSTSTPHSTPAVHPTPSSAPTNSRRLAMAATPSSPTHAPPSPTCPLP